MDRGLGKRREELPLPAGCLKSYKKKRQHEYTLTTQTVWVCQGFFLLPSANAFLLDSKQLSYINISIQQTRSIIIIIIIQVSALTNELSSLLVIYNIFQSWLSCQHSDVRLMPKFLKVIYVSKQFSTIDFYRIVTCAVLQLYCIVLNIDITCLADGQGWRSSSETGKLCPEPVEAETSSSNQIMIQTNLIRQLLKCHH